MNEQKAPSEPARRPAGLGRPDVDAYRMGRQVATGSLFRIGLGVLLGGLVVLVWASIARIDGLSRAHADSLESAVVLRRIDDMTRRLIQLESGFRAYALTGEAAYQRDWSEAERVARDGMASLARLPSRGQQWDRHRALADSLLRQWSRMHEEGGVLLPPSTATSGRMAAGASDGAGSAELMRLRSEIDRHLAALERIESDRLEERSAWAHTLRRRTILASVIGGVFIAVTTIGLTMLLLQRTSRLAQLNRMLEREGLERGAAEAALERLGRRHRLILDSAADGILELDATGTVTFLNPAALRLLRIRGQHAAGLSFRDILFGGAMRVQGEPAGEEAAATMSAIEQALRDGAVHENASATFVPANAPPLPVEVLVAPIRHRSEVNGAVLTFRDATQRREIARMKSEFVSMVSHELRTPLTSIRGALGLMASGKLGALTDAGERMLRIAVQNTDRLVRLIGNILDVERIESGRFVPECVPTDVRGIVAEGMLAMTSAAEKVGITLESEVAELTVLADHDRTVQALTNLLDNAIKFSPDGSRVRVRVRRDGGVARFSVEDEGRGIAPEHIEVIFERFRQIDSSDTRRKGGSGLGLAIARGIIQQQNGRVWAESEPASGSTFHFTLPLVTAETVQPAEATEGAAA